MTYYLSLGANLGDREATLRQALQLIEQQIGPVRRCSSFYYSKPWGFTSQNDFCNLCCALECDKTPLEVLHLTQTIERALGRTKKTQIIKHQNSNLKSQISNLKCPIYSDRTIDIDLIRAFDDDGKEIKCQISNDKSQISNLKSQMSSVPLLTLPHPLWQERDFVKVPLAEILPQNLP